MSDRALQARHQAQARVAVVHVKEGTVRSEDAQNSPYPDDQDQKACLSDICWGSSAIGHPPAWGSSLPVPRRDATTSRFFSRIPKEDACVSQTS